MTNVCVWCVCVCVRARAVGWAGRRTLICPAIRFPVPSRAFIARLYQLRGAPKFTNFTSGTTLAFFPSPSPSLSVRDVGGTTTHYKGRGLRPAGAATHNPESPLGPAGFGGASRLVGVGVAAASLVDKSYTPYIRWHPPQRDWKEVLRRTQGPLPS